MQYLKLSTNIRVQDTVRLLNIYTFVLQMQFEKGGFGKGTCKQQQIKAAFRD